jgi:hypothetical protein
MPTAVSFFLAEQEKGAAEYGAMLVMGARNYSVLVDEDGAELELTFDETLEAREAATQAVQAYRSIRIRASLPPLEPPPITGIYSFNVATDRGSEFINDAEEMFDQHRYELCVVAAQTACEISAREAVEHAATTKPVHPLAISPKRITRWSLRDPSGRQLYFAATGLKRWESGWWSAYQAHVELRSNIVHKGAGVTMEQAQASVEAMWSFVEFVRQAPRPPPI